jgi:hypothetical protein
MASCGFYGVLALEVSKAGRAAKDRSWIARSHPTESQENPKWGASWIHGELLMLGFEVAQSTVSKYMVQKIIARNLRMHFFRVRGAIEKARLCCAPCPAPEMDFCREAEPTESTIERWMSYDID